MKKLFYVLILALSSQASQAQWWSDSKEIKGNGEMASETRNVSEYDQVSLVGSMDVELISGQEGNLKVEAEQNLLEYVETKVEDGKLSISVKKGYNIRPSGDHPIRIRVPFLSLDGIELTGSGDIYTSDAIRAENFDLELIGSGDIRLPLNAQNVRASITGSGDIDLKGTADEFHCRVTGSGDISAFNFQCKKVDATVTGSGDLQVYASEELTAKVPGSGDIEYKGNPKKENFSTMGGGDITKK